MHFRSRAPSWLLPYINKEKIKTVSTFHNVYGNQNWFKKKYNSQLAKVDKIVAISKYVKSEIVNEYNIDEDKIITINRGIDVNFYDKINNSDVKFLEFKKMYNINTSKKIILYPGRLTSWKGQIEFLDIIENYKDKPILFYFVGDDKNEVYKKRLINQIIKKNLNNNCRVLGHLNKENLKMMYMCSNLVISAPLKPEGFGRTISESLAMQKIVLAYNVGGAKDQLYSLDEIYKIKNQDKDEMISKINLALNFEDNHILNLGIIARNHVINHFSKELMLRSYLNLYQEL